MKRMRNLKEISELYLNEIKIIIIVTNPAVLVTLKESDKIIEELREIVQIFSPLRFLIIDSCSSLSTTS